jgi:protein TonB
MTAKKFLIPFVLASLAGHALLLALTTRFDWGGSPQAREETVVRVELKTPPEEKAIHAVTPARLTTPAAAAARTAAPPLLREDSVALEGAKSPYGAYLLAVRRKIEGLWSYPPQALAKRQEGTALIRFSIDAGGVLTGYHVVNTSGFPALDEGALSVVRSAAPYAPLPAAFNLSKLHITATFRYRMDP